MRRLPIVLIFLIAANVHARSTQWLVENSDQDYAGSVAYFAGVMDTIHDVGFLGKCVDYKEMPEVDLLFDRFIGTQRRGKSDDKIWHGSVVASYAGFMAIKYGLKGAGKDGVCHYPDDK